MSYGLPPLLEEIAGVAGLDAALALAGGKGGEKVYFPKTLDSDHWLANLVGVEAALKICAAHPARYVEIPRGPEGSARRQRRELCRRVARMIAEGASSNQIARTCDISYRAVTRHRRWARDADQGNLFTDPSE